MVELAGPWLEIRRPAFLLLVGGLALALTLSWRTLDYTKLLMLLVIVVVACGATILARVLEDDTGGVTFSGPVTIGKHRCPRMPLEGPERSL